MSGELRRSTVVLILTSMVLVLIGAAIIRHIVAHPGWISTDAVVLDLRREAGATELWRPYERDRRYLVDARWDDENGVVHTGTVETSPFGFNGLRRGHPVRALYREDAPDILRLHEDATSEIFLVVLGIGSLIASFGVIAIGRRLERRVAG